MPPQRQIYLLDPQKLPPETIAVTFAKTSRSPQSFQQIADELTDEKSAEFHEKWVVGYGHSSVAEHAVLHVAVENISRLAVETLESNRLASYTEKSTRYQKWGSNDFHIPSELAGRPEEDAYRTACRKLFDTYQEIQPAVLAVIQRENPRQDGENDPAWERRLRSQVIDVCRFLLPASSLANVGMTINARALEIALCKMLSSPLAEVRSAGEEIKSAARLSCPTLIKYAEANCYQMETARALQQAAGAIQASESPDWCRLISVEAGMEERILAAGLYRFSGLGYAQCEKILSDMPCAEKEKLAETLFGRLGRHDQPLRETEYGMLTFEVTLDQGGYFELKRHRMMTQTPQPLTACLGYAIPRAISEAGVEDKYCDAMNFAAQTYEALADWNPDVAAYVVPNGFNRRILLSMNYRSADHFLALRSAPNAHFSMRRVAQRMAEDLRTALPLLGPYLRVEPGETWQQIEARYFTRA